MTNTPTRPILRYHGGKWILAPWIISHFPEHRVYTETFGGAASVLLRKQRSYGEIYNDLDGEIVNLFRVVRSNGEALRVVLELTPFSRTEFAESYEKTDDPLEKARRTVTRSFMGFGSNIHNKTTGFRSNSNRSGTTPAHDWKNYPLCLGAIIERLRGVCIEKRDAAEIMLAHDEDTTLHYVLEWGWDMLIGFPPCTHLSLSGARWCVDHWVKLKDKPPRWHDGSEKRRLREDAVEFFRALWEAPIERICLENPMSIASTRVAPKSQTIQPWQFGHGERKTTWLWLKNLPPLVPTNIVAGREERVWKMSPGERRSIDRARTFTGVGTAMAAQWTAAQQTPCVSATL